MPVDWVAIRFAAQNDSSRELGTMHRCAADETTRHVGAGPATLEQKRGATHPVRKCFLLLGKESVLAVVPSSPSSIVAATQQVVLT
jgi:hypothetical protein